MLTNLKQTWFHLTHQGDCNLLAITPDYTLYVEEWYGDGWLAQHALTLDGKLLSTADEQSGNNAAFMPLTLPADAIAPAPITVSKALNISGARLQGIRATDRVLDLVSPLTMTEKFALIQQFNWQLSPMALLGIAESTVFAQAQLIDDAECLVCRRLRIAYALPEVNYDLKGDAYDYDTLTIHLLHAYQPDTPPPPLDQCLHYASIFHRPMDCIAINGQLIVADAGGDLGRNRIHVFQP